jgi:succinate-acetate transporter protein
MAGDLKSGMSDCTVHTTGNDLGPPTPPKDKPRLTIIDPSQGDQKHYRFSGDNEPAHSPTHGTSPPFGGDFQAVLYAQPPTKLGDPAPLGLFSFATTTFVLSLINVGFGSVHEENIVVAMSFGFGALGQLLAGIFEMILGNTFAATAFAGYAGFWLSFAIILTPGSRIVSDLEGVSNLTFFYSVGFFLLAWAIFTTMCLLCTLKSTITFFMMFLTLDVTFIFLAAGYLASDEKGPGSGWVKAGGVFGLASSCLGYYIAFSGIADKDCT